MFFMKLMEGLDVNSYDGTPPGLTCNLKVVNSCDCDSVGYIFCFLFFVLGKPKNLLVRNDYNLPRSRC